MASSPPPFFHEMPFQRSFPSGGGGGEGAAVSLTHSLQPGLFWGAFDDACALALVVRSTSSSISRTHVGRSDVRRGGDANTKQLLVCTYIRTKKSCLQGNGFSGMPLTDPFPFEIYAAVMKNFSDSEILSRLT